MTTRRQLALANRIRAAEAASTQLHPDHISNGDERAAHRYALSFTKGLPHDYDTGILHSTADYEQFIRAIDSADEKDILATPLGPVDGFATAPDDAPLRAWESQGAGSAFDLEGPDAQAVTMPPAPAAGSAELTAEMAEVYAHALLRDVPFSDLTATGEPNRHLLRVIEALNEFEWFGGADAGRISPESAARRRGPLTPQTAFRGLAPGDDVGPYLSQFLLHGTPGLGGRNSIADGKIQYGSQTVFQRVRKVDNEDFMMSWDRWFDVQNGLDTSGDETYLDEEVFVGTGRDISTYVHYDALYQAYLNACLILLANEKVKFDPGIPFQAEDRLDHQQGFAHFGPAHILSLVTEVATRALKAVRYQKFNVHRRLRPEALAARLERASALQIPAVSSMRHQIADSAIGEAVKDMTGAACGQRSLLLPMAFPEGSPMHPSYGAGHAVVAGACVTVLKAFFDHSARLETEESASLAYVVDEGGQTLRAVDVVDAHGNTAELTVEGELNKLAANISIGRNWAGVHYFSDYWESAKMGEAIAIQILREQKSGFQENFSMTVPLLAGGATRI